MSPRFLGAAAGNPGAFTRPDRPIVSVGPATVHYVVERARLILADFGPAATTALRQLVEDAKGGDPLAPVDVIVPSAVSGVTVRRELADPALINVRFSSLPQLADRLAARRMALSGVRPLSAAARALAVRAAIRASVGRLAEAAAHPGTAALIEGVFVELDEDEAFQGDRLDHLSSASRSGGQVAAMYQNYRREVSGRATAPEILDAARDAVVEGEAPDINVIVFAPRRLSAAERRLLHALAEKDRLGCVLAHTGEYEADADANELAAWFTGCLGTPTFGTTTAAPETLLELAPDPEEEVRLAVRRVLAFFEAHPVRPERVAIAYRSSVPYLRLLDEQLTASGLPFHVAGGRSLAASVTGHALLQLVDLRTQDYARAEVLDWLSDAPIIDADGHSVPTARWDRLSREAGISRSHRGWRDRLDHFVEGIADRRSQLREAADDDERRESYDRRIEDCQALASFVDEIVASCDAVASATTWVDVSRALRSAAEHFLGEARQADRWGRETDASRWVGVERDAYDGVLSAVDALASLGDDNSTPVGYDQVRDALASELDRPLPSGTTLGRGVIVSSVRDVAGSDFDLLVLLGMAEGAFPPRLREDPILRDAEREAVGGLATVADRRRSDRRDFLAAGASARTVVLSCSRADTRAQRALHPSPWFMETVSRLNDGQPVASADLPSMDAPWLSRHDSFESALRSTNTPTSPSEYDVQLALAGRGDLLAGADLRYARGREAVVARRDGTFGEWTGHVGKLAEPLRSTVDRRLSATSLQKYATCPLQFWLDKVLGVRDLDDPADADTIDAATKGSLVHDVLERFLRTALPAEGAPGRNPDEPWNAAELAGAREVLNAAAADLEAEGVTGRPLLWQAQKARLRRQLTRILTVDSALRAARRSRPIALEDPFGRNNQDPLTLHLDRSGEVILAGYIDRVDRTDDGTLIVTDYKTGKGSGYDRIPQIGAKSLDDADLVDRGRKLQLVMYALAARQRHGTPRTPVESYYWFVELGSLHRGAPIGTDAERQLLDVVDVSVDGIRSGVFPAHPGTEGYFGWESCGFCAYQRVCPAARGEQWAQFRNAPEVQPYVAMAYPAPPSVEEGAE